MDIICYYLLPVIVGIISLSDVKGNPIALRDIYCFQNHVPRGRFGPCDTPQINPNGTADDDNSFDTPQSCCVLAGQTGGYTPNRSGSRCTSCSSVLDMGTGENTVGDDDAVDGGWTDWSSWSSCSVTCGKGIKTKTRNCTNPAPQNGGADCNGNSTKQKPCNAGLCIVDGNWGSWGPWSDCGATCGSSLTKTRSRQCDNPAPQNGGDDCEGDPQETVSCSLPECPIDGGWSDWSDWSDCPVTCGIGLKFKRRECNNPAPQYGGQNCSGLAIKNKTCDRGECPIAGGWSEWSSWDESCSAEQCGERGLQLRERHCNNPVPQNDGAYCVGSSFNPRPCINTEACPVDGGWSEWSDFGECTETCGNSSYHERHRECNNPAPRNGGQDCTGNAKETQSCDDLQPCADDDCDENDPDCQVHYVDVDCSHIDPLENPSYYELCIQELGTDVPGNEYMTTLPPTQITTESTQIRPDPLDPNDFSFSYDFS